MCPLYTIIKPEGGGGAERGQSLREGLFPLGNSLLIYFSLPLPTLSVTVYVRAFQLLVGQLNHTFFGFTQVKGASTEQFRPRRFVQPTPNQTFRLHASERGMHRAVSSAPLCFGVAGVSMWGGSNSIPPSVAAGRNESWLSEALLQSLR